VVEKRGATGTGAQASVGGSTLGGSLAKKGIGVWGSAQKDERKKGTFLKWAPHRGKRALHCTSTRKKGKWEVKRVGQVHSSPLTGDLEKIGT